MKNTNSWIGEQNFSTPRETWATVDQAAKYFQVCNITILRWIKSGRLPASKIGKSYRLAVSDLDECMQQGRQIKPTQEREK